MLNGEEEDPLEPEHVFLLMRNVLGKNERTWNSETPDLKDFGVHWTGGYDGVCADLDLPKKLSTLLQRLDVSRLTDDVLYGKAKQDRDFLGKLNAEFEFWEDAGVFLSQLHREDLSQRHILSYRRLSHFCHNFCHDNRSGREHVMKQLTQILAGGAAIGADEDGSFHDKFNSTREVTERILPSNEASSEEHSLTTQSRTANPLSSPTMRRLQSGSSSPLMGRPMSMRHMQRNSSTLGLSHSSSFTSSSYSCSDSVGGNSISAVSPENIKPEIVAKPAPLAKKKSEIRVAQEQLPTSESKASLLAALSAGLEDD